MQEVLKVRHIKHMPHVPNANGDIERLNRHINRMIKWAQLEQRREWDELLQAFVCAKRSSIHQSLGVSPYVAHYLVQLRLPLLPVAGITNIERNK